MTYDKSNTYGTYQDNRHQRPDTELLKAATPTGVRVHKLKNVPLRMPFIDRIKVLLRGSDKDLVRNGSRGYQAEMLPSSTQRGKRQRSLPGVDAIAPGSAALLASGKADRLWSANRKYGREMEYTRSNLG